MKVSRTAGGAVASNISKYDELVRSTMACLLWEDNAFEGGVSLEQRIRGLIHENDPLDVAKLALIARNEMKLRKVPLLMVRELARHKDSKKYPRIVADTLYSVIQRADEIAEFLSIYNAEKKQPISKQVKLGLSKAFTKFSEYDLGKYKSDGKAYALRDVMMLVHAKPQDVSPDMAKWDKDARALYAEQSTKAGCPVQFVREFTKTEELYGRVINKQLDTPDTWETELSSGKNKKETFTRLMAEKKLGVLAFIRNLRNMHEAGISKDVVKAYAEKVNVERALPFRFITAYKHVPAWQDVIEPMMFRCVEDIPKLPGRTVFIVDISGSMGTQLSTKSEMSRYDAAVAMAILARELCEDAVIYATAGNDHGRTHATGKVEDCRGFALNEKIRSMNKTLGGGGIFLTQVMDYVANLEQDADRVLVLTDEQDCDKKCNPANAVAFAKHNYIINIASNKNGINYEKFTHISGMSEKVLEFMRISEIM